MRTLERNERTIYHSKRRLTEGGVEYFDAPATVKANPMPISVDWTQAVGGAFETGMRSFLIDILDCRFDEGDRFYVDTVPPDDADEQMMAEGADFVVAGVEKTINTATVVLRRMMM